MVDIYYEDLNEEGKKKVLREAGLENPEEGNWDVIPLFVFNVDKE